MYFLEARVEATMLSHEKTPGHLIRVKGLAMLLCFLAFSFQSLTASSSSDEQWLGDVTCENGRSTYIDADLRAILDDDLAGEPVQAWFIFDDQDAVSSWIANHPRFPVTRYELVPGFYFTAQPRLINELLQEDEGNFIKSAWLDRVIDTKAGLKGFTPVSSVSPSEPSG
nr:hypothetical protein [Candidatus Sigynarchaeota archaeon]